MNTSKTIKEIDEAAQEEEQVIEVMPDGTEIISVGPQEAVSMQSKHLEQVARGYYLGRTSYNRNQELKRKLEDKVVGRIGRKGKLITDKLFELIEGVYVAKEVTFTDKKTGRKRVREIRYYQAPPDLKAIIYALDRVLGKPDQHVTHQDENEGLKTVSEIVKSLAKVESARARNTNKK